MPEATIRAIDFFPVSVPYSIPEASSVVFRRGVTAILTRVEDSSGRVGWGEACVGANAEAILAALESMRPFVLGSAINRRADVRAEIFHRGLWAYQPVTGSYAWCALEMAMLDLEGQATGQPVHTLLGDLKRTEVDYFFYFSRGDLSKEDEQIRHARDAGYQVVYLKVGIDAEAEGSLLGRLRSALGSDVDLRIDANGAWDIVEAKNNLTSWQAKHQVTFCEQPVPEFPLVLMQELGATVSVRLAANEGMGPASMAETLINGDVADVYTFSPYWVGGVDDFLRLSALAEGRGREVCRHTHGELGVAATAFHHAALVTPGLGRGNQQTASELSYDIIQERTPTRDSPTWGVPEAPGLGVSIDESALRRAAAEYEAQGQFLPYDPER
jgi:L-alanine-DL-glutamate epimerase-like enolase superfamily enzyme